MSSGQSVGYVKFLLEINDDPSNFSYIQRHINNILTNEHFQHISNLNFSWVQMKKYLKEELTLEGRAFIIRAIFRSPYMYKQWFEFSKNCRLSYKPSLATTKFDYFVKEQHFESQGVCR